MSGQTIRFLHIADVHLGYRQYNLTQRERDFFLSFEDAICRYALPLEEGGPPQVDFVLIAGDLFDSRQIEPVTLSRATAVLALLRDEGIPVFAIEGNHDARKRDQSPCWYDFLCGEGMMIFLRDDLRDRAIHLSPWDEDERRGGYYDVNEHVRVIGSHWYGASSHVVIDRFREAIEALPPKPFNIMMFHGGLSNHVNELSGGVDYEVMLALRPCVQYLALGHIHKQYSMQNWLFNPGSLEVSKSREYDEPHGAYIGEIRLEDMSLHVTHHQDYLKRPFITLFCDCERYTTPEMLLEGVLQIAQEEGSAKIRQEKQNWPSDIDMPAPVLHVYLTGILSFPFSSIPLSDLESQLSEMLSLEYVRFSNDTQPLEYTPDEEYPRDESGHLDREALEARVFQNLIHADTRYSDQSHELARFTSSLKENLLREALQNDHEQEILIQKLHGLLRTSPSTEKDDSI